MIANRGTGTPAGRDPKPGKEIVGDIEGHAVQASSVNGGVYFIRNDSRIIPNLILIVVILGILAFITYLLRTDGTPRMDRPPAPTTAVASVPAPGSTPAPPPAAPRSAHAVAPRPRATRTTTTSAATLAPPVSPPPSSAATEPRTEPTTTTTTTPATSTTAPDPTSSPALLA